MDTGNIMLAILKNIPPQTIALLILVCVLNALLQTLPRKRRSNYRKPHYGETPFLKDEKKQKQTTLTSEERKGQRGEDSIAKILYKTVPGEFQVFRNVYVPNNGKTSEIDLVMVHETGIFVFESKNYRGWIYGSMEDLHWTQMFPNREKHTFYNPVRQNHNHIKALSQYLDIPERFFYSYVVFSDYCKLNKVPENTRSTVITQAAQLKTRLRDTISAFPPLYGTGEIEIIADRLLPLTNVDSSVKEQHIADIRAAQESEVCPWCGNALVLREGRYGVFWGCASYPRCRFTRKAG